MFKRLFEESGLSLDRLRALLEVGASGSIVKAAGGDPVRQSQFSRQIKELEDFFRTRLVERHGRGVRLTTGGRELARISRFFLLGLSNFQQGSLAEEQTIRIGGGPTLISKFLAPELAGRAGRASGARYVVETVRDEEIERRLHDLTLDFGVVTAPSLSRPLQMMALGEWALELWVPRSLAANERAAAREFKERRLPLALAMGEIRFDEIPGIEAHEPRLVCDGFSETIEAMKGGSLAALVPEFLQPAARSSLCFRVSVPELESRRWRYSLAWNPRMLRLNPRAAKWRDSLADALVGRLRAGGR
jgi:DNA-binding transcriptional LysR family regulator